MAEAQNTTKQEKYHFERERFDLRMAREAAGSVVWMAALIFDSIPDVIRLGVSIIYEPLFIELRVIFHLPGFDLSPEVRRELSRILLTSGRLPNGVVIQFDSRIT